VTVRAYNLKSEAYEMVCQELPARVWQHEIDHLAGVLFIDKMGSMGRHRSQKDLEKFIEDFEKAKKKGDLPPDLLPKL
jgi:peptide deformylase